MNRISRNITFIRRMAALAVCLTVTFTYSTGCTSLSKIAEDLQNAREADRTESNDNGGKTLDSFKFYGDEDLPLLQQLDYSMFAASATSDSLSLDFFLKDPKAFGLSISKPTLGEISLAQDEESYGQNEDCLSLMKDIDYDALSEKDQILYDVLQYDLKEAVQYKGFYYYSSPLNSITGMQTQLPLILSEYRFDTEKDVKVYIKLLKDFSRYFGDLMDFEKTRSEKGLGASDENIQKIIDSCNSFLEDRDNHFMISSFDERIDAMTDLDEQQKEDYKQKNIDALETSVFPAYEMLIDSFNDLLGTGKNEGGLCNLDNGKEYYALLLKSETSTDMTPEEAVDAIEKSIDEQLDIVSKVNFDADFSNAYDTYSFSMGTPEQNLDYCKDLIATDFPAIMDHNVTLKEVPSQLEDFFSPAAYLTCPIDDPTDNLILVNSAQLDGYQNLLDTIAHEGYPGHMYEAIYHAQNTASYYQRSATFSGYSEGWAMYAGEYVVRHTDAFDQTLVGYTYAEDTLLNTLIPSRIDIGVNYEGWTVDDVNHYLKDLGLEYPDYGDYCYGISVEIPCYYLPYCIGQIETNRILNEAFDEYGDSLSVSKIHDVYLSEGPGPFPIVEKYFDEDLKNAKNVD